MIKRNASWTREEEWILFLLNRDEANKWADIANVLEGRTDNTIKNHWNSSMKRRIREYQEEFAQKFSDMVRQNSLPDLGQDIIALFDDQVHIQTIKSGKQNSKGFSKVYVKIMKQLEEQLLEKKKAQVKQ